MARRPAAVRGLRLDLEGIEEAVGDIGHLRKDLPRLFQRVLSGRAGHVIAEQAAKRIPTRSGMMRDEMRVRGALDPAKGVVIGPGEGRHGIPTAAGNETMSLQYIGTFLEGGARPHEITARHAERLHGDAGFRVGVFHPGFRGKRIMGRTLRLKAVEAAVLGHISAEVDRVAGGSPA